MNKPLAAAFRSSVSPAAADRIRAFATTSTTQFWEKMWKGESGEVKTEDAPLVEAVGPRRHVSAPRTAAVPPTPRKPDTQASGIHSSRLKQLQKPKQQDVDGGTKSRIPPARLVNAVKISERRANSPFATGRGDAQNNRDRAIQTARFKPGRSFPVLTTGRLGSNIRGTTAPPTQEVAPLAAQLATPIAFEGPEIAETLAEPIQSLLDSQMTKAASAASEIKEPAAAVQVDSPADSITLENIEVDLTIEDPLTQSTGLDTEMTDKTPQLNLEMESVQDFPSHWVLEGQHMPLRNLSEAQTMSPNANKDISSKETPAVIIEDAVETVVSKTSEDVMELNNSTQKIVQSAEELKLETETDSQTSSIWSWVTFKRLMFGEGVTPGKQENTETELNQDLAVAEQEELVTRKDAIKEATTVEPIFRHDKVMMKQVCEDLVSENPYELEKGMHRGDTQFVTETVVENHVDLDAANFKAVTSETPLQSSIGNIGEDHINEATESARELNEVETHEVSESAMFQCNTSELLEEEAKIMEPVTHPICEDLASGEPCELEQGTNRGDTQAFTEAVVEDHAHLETANFTAITTETEMTLQFSIETISGNTNSELNEAEATTDKPETKHIEVTQPASQKLEEGTNRGDTQAVTEAIVEDHANLETAIFTANATETETTLQSSIETNSENTICEPETKHIEVLQPVCQDFISAEVCELLGSGTEAELLEVLTNDVSESEEQSYDNLWIQMAMSKIIKQERVEENTDCSKEMSSVEVSEHLSNKNVSVSVGGEYDADNPVAASDEHLNLDIKNLLSKSEDKEAFLVEFESELQANKESQIVDTVTEKNSMDMSSSKELIDENFDLEIRNLTPTCQDEVLLADPDSELQVNQEAKAESANTEADSEDIFSSKEIFDEFTPQVIMEKDGIIEMFEASEVEETEVFQNETSVEKLPEESKNESKENIEAIQSICEELPLCEVKVEKSLEEVVFSEDLDKSLNQCVNNNHGIVNEQDSSSPFMEKSDSKSDKAEEYIVSLSEEGKALTKDVEFPQNQFQNDLAEPLSWESSKEAEGFDNQPTLAKEETAKDSEKIDLQDEVSGEKTLDSVVYAKVGRVELKTEEEVENSSRFLIVKSTSNNRATEDLLTSPVNSNSTIAAPEAEEVDFEELQSATANANCSISLQEELTAASSEYKADESTVDRYSPGITAPNHGNDIQPEIIIVDAPKSQEVDRVNTNNNAERQSGTEHSEAEEKSEPGVNAKEQEEILVKKSTLDAIKSFFLR